MKKLWRVLNQVHGFSLIEAIITVAIVGIIVVPISLVFTGSLIDATEAKELLKVTQLAQLYIENIKAKSESELMDDFFIADPSEVSKDRTLKSDDVNTSGFPTIPEGYKVRLMFDKGETSFSSYTNDDDEEDDDDSDTFEVDGDISLYPDPEDMISREIIINYNNDDADASIETKLIPTTGVVTTSTQTIPINNSAIKIDCGDSDLDTIITVNNDNWTALNLYIYKNNMSTLNLEVDGINYVKFDNLQEDSEATDKIYAITVQIIKENQEGTVDDDEIVAEMTATKIDE